MIIYPFFFSLVSKGEGTESESFSLSDPAGTHSGPSRSQSSDQPGRKHQVADAPWQWLEKSKQDMNKFFQSMIFYKLPPFGWFSIPEITIFGGKSPDKKPSFLPPTEKAWQGSCFLK